MSSLYEYEYEYFIDSYNIDSLTLAGVGGKPIGDARSSHTPQQLALQFIRYIIIALHISSAFVCADEYEI